MNYKEIIQSLESRKQNMIHVLNNQSTTIPPEKQHQIYGAVNEISVLLNTIQYCREKEGEKERGFEIPVSNRLSQLNKSRVIEFVDK